MNVDNNYIPIYSVEINSNDDPTLQTISLTLYTIGCIRKCVNCQNPSLQDFNQINNTNIYHLNDIKKLINNKSILIKSVCFCGGDFLPQYEYQLNELIDYCIYKNLKTILYTGELYKNINNTIRTKLNIIIDGPYKEDLKNKEFNFPASTNQKCYIDNVEIDYKELRINKIRI